MMKKILWVIVSMCFLLLSCTEDTEIFNDNTGSNSQVKIPVNVLPYYNGTRSDVNGNKEFDSFYFYLFDNSGNYVNNIKGKYLKEIGKLSVEGLHKGDYKLAVLAVRGDERVDSVKIIVPHTINDKIIEFPKKLNKSLAAEYFYGITNISVNVEKTQRGNVEQVKGDVAIDLRHITSRIQYRFNYRNDYIKFAVKNTNITYRPFKIYGSILGNGNYSDETEVNLGTFDVSQETILDFLPVIHNSKISGNIRITSKNYEGKTIEQSYNSNIDDFSQNNLYTLTTNIVHPEDNSPVMYITKGLYNSEQHLKILQDDEPVSVYTDKNQRMFNTAEPLQVSITREGKLHVRFYSPRDLHNVLIKAKFPNVSDEYFDLAFFDSIPAFVDFYRSVSLVEYKTTTKLEGGKYIDVPKLTPEMLTNVEFKIESPDDYWKKIKKIKHGWTIYWGLYGGDPSKDNGGPVGNWMGIRPVHCRESIALLTNFTYMIDLPKHEKLLKNNASRLYDDNKKPVTPEKVLAQMRQPRTLQVGLVYPGNGVLGLGGGSTYGAYQQAWFEHYWNAYSCNIMFHELGHVMGYGHNSSFTYGPWAEQIMNNFYVNNIKDFPIDSPKYLNSKQNPNRYK